MNQQYSKSELGLIIVISAGVLILFWLLNNSCSKCNKKAKGKKVIKEIKNRQDSTFNSGSFSGIDDVYDSQDYYQKNPYIYPVNNSYQTALYKIIRNQYP